MELPFLVSVGILPRRCDRGLLREAPFELQCAVAAGVVRHTHAVLAPFMPMINGPLSDSSAAVASEEAMRLASSSTHVFFSADVAVRGSNDNDSAAEATASAAADCFARMAFPDLFSAAPNTAAAAAAVGDVPPLRVPLLRSTEDLVYLTNTIGIAFSFPCTASSGGGNSGPLAGLGDVVAKAIDVYGLLLSANFHDVAMSHIPPAVRTAHFVEMVEHVTALLGTDRAGCPPLTTPAAAPSTSSSSGMTNCGNSSGSVGLQRHAELVGRLVDVLSKGLWWMQPRLSASQWAHILRLLVGCMRYWTAERAAFAPAGSAVLASLASLFWEAVVLSDTRADDIWAVIAAGLAPTAEVVSQWGYVMVALSRAMARISMGADTIEDKGEEKENADTDASNAAVPRPITVRWVGLQPHVRPASHFIHLGEASVAFLWKRLAEVVYSRMVAASSSPSSFAPLLPDMGGVVGTVPTNSAAAPTIATRVIFTGALRDMSLLLSHGSYLVHCPPRLTYDLSHRHERIGPSARAAPLGPSSAAICAMLGDMLTSGLLIGSDAAAAASSSAADAEAKDALTVRALQGLAFALFRRETAVAVAAEARKRLREAATGSSNSNGENNDDDEDTGEHHTVPPHLALFFSAIAVLNSERGPIIRGEVVLHSAPLFFIDLPAPLLAIEAIGTAAAALLSGAFDDADGGGGFGGSGGSTGGGDDEDGEEDSADVARAAVTKVWGVVALLNTYAHARVLGIPSLLPSAVLSAVHAGLETQARLGPVAQRLMCAATALFFSFQPAATGLSAGTPAALLAAASSPSQPNAAVGAKLSSILQSILSTVSAPYGSAEPDTLLTALACLAAMPLHHYAFAAAQHVVAAICQCCSSARAVMEQVDLGIEDTTSVYVFAARALCGILSGPLGPSLCADKPTSEALLAAVEAGTRDALVPSTGMRDAAASLYHCYTYALCAPVADGSAASSSAESERDFLAGATAVKCFALGSFRLVTLVQHKTGVAMIIRDPSGRRVFKASQAAFPLLSIRGEAEGFAKALEEARDRHRNIAAGSGATGGAADDSSPNTQPSMEAAEAKLLAAPDPLAAVWAEPAVGRFVEALRASDRARDTVAAMSAARLAKRDGYGVASGAYTEPTAGALPPFAPSGSDRIVKDAANDAVEGSRQVAAAVLQLGKGPVRSVPFDSDLVAVLKGIDALPSKELLDIAVVCVVNDEDETEGSAERDAPPSYWSFVSSLGRRISAASDACESTSPTEGVVFEDGYRRIHFRSAVAPASAVDEVSIAANNGPNNSTHHGSAFASVRVLWDATSEGHDWPNIPHAAHEALREVSPNFRPSVHRRSFDIILRPLPSVGLISVRLRLPEPLAPTVEPPLRWGAPLLHGSTLPSVALPPLLREAVHGAATHRLMEAGVFKFPSLVRKAAIWGVAAPHPIQLPLQYLASLDEAGSVERPQR